MKKNNKTKKGYIILEKAANNVLSALHGYRFPIKRLLIPSENNLAVTVHRDQLYILPNFEGGIDIPKSLVKNFLDFNKAKKGLQKKVENIFASN